MGRGCCSGFSSANEEDEREVLIKLSISSVVIRSGEEPLEWIPGDVCVYGRGRGVVGIEKRCISCAIILLDLQQPCQLNKIFFF